MKCSLKLTPNLNNCYISLPQKFSSNLPQVYNEKFISLAIKMHIFSLNSIFYVGYNGKISKNDNEIEISENFAKINNLKENEIVSISIENNKNSLSKIDVYCQNSEDYEIINSKRGIIENSFLNTISVLFSNVKIPVYFSNSQYIILEWKNKNNEFFYINPQSEITIFVNENNKNKQKKKISFIKFAIHKLNEEKSGNLENYFYINEKIFNEINVKENVLYKIYYKTINHKQSMKDLTAFYFKIDKNNKKKKEIKVKYAYFRPKKFEDNSENHILIDKFLIKSLKFQKNMIIFPDFNEQCNDFSHIRILNFQEFIKPNSKIFVIIKFLYKIFINIF